MLKKSLAGILGAGLVAALALAAAPTATAGQQLVDLDDHAQDPAYAKYYHQRLTWVSDIAGCNADPGVKLECARVLAPRDWQDPSKGDLTVTISRNPGEEIGTKRLLLTNPGGPGGGGLTMSHYVAADLKLTTHMPVGIDPRGVGESSELVCPAFVPNMDGIDVDGDARTFTRATIQAGEREQARYYAACAAAPNTLLPYINSYQTAFDFNLVRALFGQSTTDYYGTSYGTWLGAVMEKAFPNKFDRVILDSNLDWSRASLVDGFAWQYQAFQVSFDRGLLPFLSRHDDVFHLGKSTGEVSASYERIRALSAAKPGLVAPNTIDAVLLTSAYGVRGLTPAGTFLVAVGTLLDDPKLAGTMSREQAQKIFDAYKNSSAAGSNDTFAAVMCGDTPNPAEFYDRNLSLARSLPLTSWSVSNPCKGWPYKPVMDDKFFQRPMGNVLMLQNEVDGATSYNGALDARMRTRGNVKMVVVTNQFGHGAAWTPTLTNTALPYLRDGKFPTSDVRSLGFPMRSNGVNDAKVYEYMHSSSPQRTLPARYFYIFRDLSDPRVDQEATDALPKPTDKVGPAAVDVDPMARVRELTEKANAQVWKPRF